jgi:hypothetical protein
MTCTIAEWVDASGAAEVTGQKVTDITKLVDVIEGEPAEAMDLS